EGGVFPGIGVPWADPARLWQQVLEAACAACPVPGRRWGRDPAALLADDLAIDTVRSLSACLLDLADPPHPYPSPARGEGNTAHLFPARGEGNRWAGLDPVAGLTLLAGRMAWDRAQMSALDRRRVGVILG